MRTSAGLRRRGHSPGLDATCAASTTSPRKAAKGNKPDHGDDDAEQDAPSQRDDDPRNDEDPAKSDTDTACVPRSVSCVAIKSLLFEGEHHASRPTAAPTPGSAGVPMRRVGRSTTSTLRMQTALWLATAEVDEFPRLEGDIEVDVAVVGAGITGVAVAHLLKREGKSVALSRCAGSVWERQATRRQADCRPQPRVRETLRLARPDAARLYAESNREAISQLGTLAAELGIDCDWEPASNYVYTESSGRLDKLEDELEAMRRADIADMTRETDLPFPVAGAIRVDEQAQFHPLKYLAGLVARFRETEATSSSRRGRPA